MTTHALARLDQTTQGLLPDRPTWETMLDMADALYKSGLLPTSIRSPQAALAVIQKGQELRIPPMAALSEIGVINGKPVCSAALMAALIYRDHGDQALLFDVTSELQCVIRYKRRGWAQWKQLAWTAEDARRAGLLGQRGPWTQYTPAMLRARCISAVARLAFPDSIGGLYTHEELGAEVTVTSDGEIVPVGAPAPVTALRDDPAPQTAPGATSGDPGAVGTDDDGPDVVDEIIAARARMLTTARRYRGQLRRLGVRLAEKDDYLLQMSNDALANEIMRLREEGRRLTAEAATSEDRAERVEAWLRIFFGTTKDTWLADDDDARHAWVEHLTNGEHRSVKTWFESLDRVEQFEQVMRRAEDDKTQPPFVAAPDDEED